MHGSAYGCVGHETASKFIIYINCLFTTGHIHLANLGDGDGRKPEALLFRQHYRVPGWGTCWESIAGGHHFRAWRQNGTEGNSGAWFLG